MNRITTSPLLVSLNLPWICVLHYSFTIIFLQNRELDTFEKSIGNRIATFICYVRQNRNKRVFDLKLTFIFSVVGCSGWRRNSVSRHWSSLLASKGCHCSFKMLFLFLLIILFLSVPYSQNWVYLKFQLVSLLMIILGILLLFVFVLDYFDYWSKISDIRCLVFLIHFSFYFKMLKMICL